MASSSSSNPRTTLRQSSPATTNAPATSGSQTITQPSNPTLRLRGQHNYPSTHNNNDHQQPLNPTSSRRHIQWDSSVIDNEGMGRKSSKVCCIYHAPHEPDDSESDDSSSDSSDSDSEADLSRAQRAGGRKGKKGGGGKSGDGKGTERRKASPNAYERQPKGKGKARKEEG